MNSYERLEDFRYRIQVMETDIEQEIWVRDFLRSLIEDCPMVVLKSVATHLADIRSREIEGYKLN